MTDVFRYSQDFEDMIVRLHRGMERLPHYRKYLSDHLGGPSSRLVKFSTVLCREIEHHCGNLAAQRILDFGCGTGATTAALARLCWQVCAYDINTESLGICTHRIKEHGFQQRVTFYSGALSDLKALAGTFDIILMNGVLEHIPASRDGMRQTVLQAAFNLLKPSGYLFINDTPNRILPFDGHSTQLWWIPWTKPGSEWAYKRAVAKGRHSSVPTISDGPLGLEEAGAWGITYWELKRCLKGVSFECVNTLRGHDRHIFYVRPAQWKRTVFEWIMYHFAVRLFHVPMTAFFPSITNLVLKKVPIKNANA